MRIGFDAKRAIQNLTGLGNYSRYVLEGLVKTDSSNEYYLYAPKSPHNERAKSFLHSNELLQLMLPKGFWKKLRFLWRVWGVVKDLERQNIQLFHGLSNELPLSIRRKGNIKSVVTIHDLIFLHYPKYYPLIDRKIYNYKFRKACEFADKIIAVSECTKRDIVNYYRIPAEKIEVIYQGCAPAFSAEVPKELQQEVAEKYKLPSRYILNVGSIEERKNVLLIVKSLHYLSDEISLVVVGKRTKYCDVVESYVKTHGLAHRVKILHSVVFRELPALYKMASVFAYPSRFEGFGIPILEALNVGVPVVAATGSCLEEAGGQSSIYVSPDDVKGMADACNRILSNSQLQHQMVASGQEYAKRFSQERQSNQILALYRNLLGESV